MIALLILSVYAAPADEVFCVTNTDNTDQTTCDADVVSTDSPCYFDRTGRGCATVTECGQLGDRCDVEILGGDDYCGTKDDQCLSALAECATLDEQECDNSASFKCAWADEACGYSGADSGAGYAIFSAAMSALFVASLF